MSRTSLQLPPNADLATDEGRKLLNDRLRQIEIELARATEPEIALAAKAAYGALAGVPATATPVEGCKIVLDRAGTWLILASAQWANPGGASTATAFVVVDPQDAETAIRQPAVCDLAGNTAGTVTVTGWALFTVTRAPRLVQLYAKKLGGGAIDLVEPGTHIGAVWIGGWEPGGKRFGRQTPTVFDSVTDLTGAPITDHGEEARYPFPDHPETMPLGVELPDL